MNGFGGLAAGVVIAAGLAWAGGAFGAAPLRVEMQGRTLADVASELHRLHGIQAVIVEPGTSKGQGTAEGEDAHSLVHAVLRAYGRDGFLMGDLLVVGGVTSRRRLESEATDAGAMKAVAELLRRKWEALKPVEVPQGAWAVVVPVDLNQEEAGLVRENRRRAAAETVAAARNGSAAWVRDAWLRSAGDALLVETLTPAGPTSVLIGARRGALEMGRLGLWQALAGRPTSGSEFRRTLLGVAIQHDGLRTVGEVAKRIGDALGVTIELEAGLEQIPVALTGEESPAAALLDGVCVGAGCQWRPVRDALVYRVTSADPWMDRVGDRWAVVLADRGGRWAEHLWSTLTDKERARLGQGEKVAWGELPGETQRWLEFWAHCQDMVGLAAASQQLWGARKGRATASVSVFSDGVVLGSARLGLDGWGVRDFWILESRGEVTDLPRRCQIGVGDGSDRWGIYDLDYLAERRSANRTHRVRLRSLRGFVVRGSWGAPPPWEHEKGDIAP